VKPEISNISTVRNCADTIMRHGLKPGGKVFAEVTSKKQSIAVIEDFGATYSHLIKSGLK